MHAVCALALASFQVVGLFKGSFKAVKALFGLY
jgi:hypothetical protein